MTRTMAIVACTLVLTGCGSETKELAAAFGQAMQDAADQRRQMDERVAEIRAMADRELMAETLATSGDPELELLLVCQSPTELYTPLTIPAALENIADSRLRARRQAWLDRLQQVAEGCNVCLSGEPYEDSDPECVLNVGSEQGVPANGVGSAGAAFTVLARDATEHDRRADLQFELCGLDRDTITIDPDEPDYLENEHVLDAFAEADVEIDEVDRDLVLQDDPLLLLATYGKALAEAAAADDIDDLETAMQDLVTKAANLAALAGPKGVAISTAISAVGRVTVRLTGLILYVERLSLVRQSVIAADPLVEKLGFLACHDSLLEFHDDASFHYSRLVDLVAYANDAAHDSDTDSVIERGRRTVDALEALEAQLVEYRTFLAQDPLRAGLQVAAAHTALRRALEDPGLDFDQAKALIEGFVTDIQASAAALEALATANP